MDGIAAKFEISIDGTPRTYRDTVEIARGKRPSLKQRNPICKVAVRYLQNKRADHYCCRWSPDRLVRHKLLEARPL